MRYLGQIKPVRPVDATREALALLKILALGNRQLAEGKVKPIAEIVRRLAELLQASRDNRPAPQNRAEDLVLQR